jgi:isoquinoline 1-oxidoreductase beta subunit
MGAFRRQAQSAATPKPRAEWRLAGRSVAADRRPVKVSGSAIFAADIRLPGMLFAAVRNAPVIGGRVVGIDAARAAAMPGVTAVIEVPGRRGSGRGVLVAGPSALEAVTIRFASASGVLDADAIARDLRATAESDSGTSAFRRGDAKAALERAARVVSAEYSVAVPGACDDGADELRRRRQAGWMRSVGRHARTDQSA